MTDAQVTAAYCTEAQRAANRLLCLHNEGTWVVGADFSFGNGAPEWKAVGPSFRTRANARILARAWRELGWKVRVYRIYF